MPLANSSTVRYDLHCHDGADQCLQVRLGYFSRLLSRSPSVGLPYVILQQTPSTVVADTIFSLPLRELEDPLLCHAYIRQLLNSFELGDITSSLIAQKITSHVVPMATENYNAKFHLVADIEYIQMFWMEQSSVVPENGRRGIVVEEVVILDGALTRREAEERERTIERVKREKFDGFETEELKNCSICYDELMEEGKEVSRISCGHVFHKSCILTWLPISNSCPLCRKKLEE